MPTATQYKHQILDYCEDNGIEMSSGRAMKHGIRLHRMRDEVRDFEDGLRILGILSDSTPREAVRNIERGIVAV